MGSAKREGRTKEREYYVNQAGGAPFRKGIDGELNIQHASGLK